MAKGVRFASPSIRAKRETEKYVFRCIACDAYASYGMGVSLKRGIEGVWYCREHVPPEFFESWETDDQPEKSDDAGGDSISSVHLLD